MKFCAPLRKSARRILAVSAVALLVFFSTATGAGVISSYFGKSAHNCYALPLAPLLHSSAVCLHLCLAGIKSLLCGILTCTFLRCRAYCRLSFCVRCLHLLWKFTWALLGNPACLHLNLYLKNAPFNGFSNRVPLPANRQDIQVGQATFCLSSECTGSG